MRFPLPRESAGSIFSSTVPAAVHSASLSFPPPLLSESMSLPAVRGQEDSGPGASGLLRVLALPCHFKSRSGLPSDTHSAWRTPLVPSWPQFADRRVSADGVPTQWQSQEPGCPGRNPLCHFGGVWPCVLCLSVSSEMAPRGACRVWLWWLHESVHMKPLGVSCSELLWSCFPCSPILVPGGVGGCRKASGFKTSTDMVSYSFSCHQPLL